jgi:alpha-glucosidase
MRLGVLIQMTWIGSPALYYADEVGQVGWTDPDCRRTYPFGHEDWDMFDFHKKAIALRKHIHCLRLGSLIKLDAGNGYIVYGRFDIFDSAVIVINNSDKELALSIPVWMVGVTWTDKMKCVFSTDHDGYNQNTEMEVAYGRMYVTIAPKSGAVYQKIFDGHPLRPLHLYKGKVHFIPANASQFIND